MTSGGDARRRASVVRRALAAALAMSFVAPGSPVGAAGETGDRLRSAGRIVRAFDFEERDFNADPVPAHWIRAHHSPGSRERPGFPSWNESSFDDSVSVSGRHSVRLPTRGGSVSLRLVTGVIAAIPESDYHLSAFVRTEGLRWARARLTARYLNDRAEPVYGGEVSSEPIDTQGEWRPVTIDLPGNFPDAAWIQIDLELLQPEQLTSASELASHRRRHEDYSGAAWFDDVMVLHKPRVRMWANSPTNFIVAPERPVITCELRDLAGQELVCALTARGVRGEPLASIEKRMDAGGGEFRWEPELPGFGWSSVDLVVMDAGQVLHEETMTMVWAPALGERPREELRRFEIAAETLRPGAMALAPEMLRRIGVGAATLTVWDSWMDEAAARSWHGSVAPVVQRLLDDDVQLTLALRSAPTIVAAARETDTNRLFDLLADERVWDEHIGPIVARYGQRIRRWRLGAIGDRDVARRPDAAGQAEALRRGLARLAPSPVVVLPINADQAPEPVAASGAALALNLPHSFESPSVQDLARRWSDGSEAWAHATLAIEVPPADIYGAEAQVIEVAQRMVFAWAAGARGLTLADGWDAAGEGPRLTYRPRPALAAFREVMRWLSGREATGEFPAGGAVRAWILQGRDGDAIVAWAQSAPRATLRGRLGEGEVRVTDVFGNTRVVEPIEGMHAIALEETPVLIEGVDARLAHFQAGFGVEPEFIPSTAAAHTLLVRLHNPWNTGLAGRLRIERPEDWKIQPRVSEFLLGPGETKKVPFEVSFGVGEEAGSKEVEVLIEFQGESGRERLLLRAPLEIGLPTLDLTPSHRYDPKAAGGRGGLVVTLLITNLSDRPATLEAWAAAPGKARESATVSGLAPNDSVVRRFTFEGPFESFFGKRVRTGLIEADGPGRLTTGFEVK